MARPDASAKLAKAQPKQGPSKVLIGAVIATVLIIFGGIAWLRTDPFGGLEAKGPKGSNAEGGGVVMYPGKAKKGVPVVDVYEDFQCPGCGELEKMNGKSMSDLAAKGDIKLVVHMMSFLDENLGNNSSSRAANAAFCAADAGTFPAYHAAVFASQPAEEGKGFSDAILKKAAGTAGITGAQRTKFNTCTSKGTYNSYVDDTQKASEKAGVNSTPTVKIDGEALPEDQVTTLRTEANSFPKVLKQAT
jgi:protein-disulfide isomerase